eukprot:2298592-Amphidinium_carterae.2
MQWRYFKFLLADAGLIDNANGEVRGCGLGIETNILVRILVREAKQHFLSGMAMTCDASDNRACGLAFGQGRKTDNHHRQNPKPTASNMRGLGAEGTFDPGALGRSECNFGCPLEYWCTAFVPGEKVLGQEGKRIKELLGVHKIDKSQDCHQSGSRVELKVAIGHGCDAWGSNFRKPDPAHQ